jgi:hypothetical protein
MTVASEWAVGEVFLTMLYFYLFFLWVWLVITVFADIIRSKDQSGWAKAGWSILVIALPFIGVFIYIIARGGKIGDRALELATRRRPPRARVVPRSASSSCRRSPRCTSRASSTTASSSA